VALACFGALASALVSQHVYDMQPCPWCVLQRLWFVVMGLVALVGLALALGQRTGSGPSRSQRIAAACVVVIALAGVGTALWQHFVAASSASCDLTLADRIMSATGLDMLLPQVFAAYASCADAAVELLGVSYELWSLALFVVLGALAVIAGRRV
jgi:disulfide bond formation protein DsbB